MERQYQGATWFFGAQTVAGRKDVPQSRLSVTTFLIFLHILVLRFRDFQQIPSLRFPVALEREHLKMKLIKIRGTFPSQSYDGGIGAGDVNSSSSMCVSDAQLGVEISQKFHSYIAKKSFEKRKTAANYSTFCQKLCKNKGFESCL